MIINGIYKGLEYCLLISLLIQVIWNIFGRNKKFEIKHLGILFYFSFWITNAIVYLLKIGDFFFFFHAFAPPFFIYALTKNNIALDRFLIIIPVSIAWLNFHFELYIMIVIFYYVAIFLCIHQAIKLSKRKGSELVKSRIYLALCLDLFVTLLILNLKLTDFHWPNSHLLIYFRYFRLSIYSFTLILINIDIRRFFIE